MGLIKACLFTKHGHGVGAKSTQISLLQIMSEMKRVAINQAIQQLSLIV